MAYSSHKICYICNSNRKYTNDSFTIGINVMRIKIFLSILVILLTLQLSARPIKPGRYTFNQPDGSVFIATCVGDEFMKIIKTADGHAIIRDEDGWWCYAIYNPDGSKYSSGYHVGNETPQNILSQSRAIPYAVLSENAEAKRSVFHHEEENILKRTMRAKGARLMGEGEPITKHGLIILAQYQDVQFKKNHGRDAFVDLLTKERYNVNGATGSAKEYFDSQFESMFEFEFEVSEIVTLSGRRAYYGQNTMYDQDLRPAEMIEEACRLAYESGIKFSKYDDDSDGYVDNVFVLFAGEDEADNPDENADCIWSHSWYIKSGAGIDLVLDGKIIDQYACTSELMAGGYITGIGTFCHEFAHTLGLPDLYDTNYEKTGGWAAGLWNSTSLMDGGNQNNNYNTPPYFNAIEREILGLSKPITLERNGSYTLQPIHQGGQYYKIPSAETPSEYYMLECRSSKGWDTYIGGSGMLVYHIDKSKPKVWLENTVNTKPTHQYADLIEADGRNDVLTEDNYHLLWNISGVFFPYDNVTTLTPESDPGIKFWDGSEVETCITDIKRSGDNITFIVSGLKGETPPTPINLTVDPFMDAAIVSFESDRPFDGEAEIRWGKSGQEDEWMSVKPYETGKYAVIIEGLIPGNKTYSVIVSFEMDGITGAEKKISFMTKRTVPVEWSYIYIGQNANADGTYNVGTKIPLRVYNTDGAEAIEWEFNGKTIYPAGDGYYTITEGGILRATVYWSGGGTDILEKQIILSE